MKYIQDPETLKLVPAEEYYRRQGSHFVQGEIEPFRSHVDGTMITSRKELREHNARHGVVHGGEIEQDYQKQRKAREDFYAGRPYDTKRRLDALKFATEVHESGRSKADIKQMVENYRNRSE